jgi:hypothetical protein
MSSFRTWLLEEIGAAASRQEATEIVRQKLPKIRALKPLEASEQLMVEITDAIAELSG